MSIAKNVGVAVGIVLLTSVELKIDCMLYAIHKLNTTSSLGRHPGYLVGARFVLFPPSCSLSYSGKLTKAFPLTPTGYKMAAKKVV